MKNAEILKSKTWLAVLIILCPLSVFSSETADTAFTAVIRIPGCSVSVPGDHSLGNMVAGTKKTRVPYTMKVVCEANRPYVLYAEAIGAPSSGADWAAMLVDGKAPAPGAETTLKLLKNGTPVNLQGAGKDDNSATFCSGETARACTLVPEVNVPVNAEKGYVSTTVRFTLRHT